MITNRLLKFEETVSDTSLHGVKQIAWTGPASELETGRFCRTLFIITDNGNTSFHMFAADKSTLS